MNRAVFGLPLISETTLAAARADIPTRVNSGSRRPVSQAVRQCLERRCGDEKWRLSFSSRFVPRPAIPFCVRVGTNIEVRCRVGVHDITGLC